MFDSRTVTPATVTPAPVAAGRLPVGSGADRAQAGRRW
jgi:hypothetical protein